MAKQNLFNSIKLFKPKNNVFDLTHDVKLSLNMGDLVPICIMETVPGDKFEISCESILRFAPMIAPVMHRMNVYMHYFFVPNRIIWPGWEKWIVGEQPGQTLPVPPFVTINETDYNDNPLVDYIGLPYPGVAGAYAINPMALAAYQRCYQDYYRDQNLVTDPIWNQPFQLLDGDNGTIRPDLLAMRKRAWEHDYFTAALPFAQKGDAVSIPLGSVELNPDWNANGSDPLFKDALGFPNGPGTLQQDLTTPPGQIEITGIDQKLAYDPDGSLEVGATTINDLRRAFKLQEWLEKNARAGSRYVENILAHFGVRSSDARLQRPEYITGTKSPVVISEILNSTGEEGGLPQGNMAGHGISVTSGKYGKKFCEEHGYIIGIMSVIPRTAYQQGIPKHFLKNEDQFQYFWPAFANIGEQPVENREVYAPHSDPIATFGYTPRYAEYKYIQNRVAGDFKTTLDYWHLGRIFAGDPVLNQEFIECNPDPRIFAVTDPTEDKLYCHVLNKVRAVRPMPKFGTPTF